MSGPSNEQNKNSEQRLWDLASHVAQYVTVNELARYWTISRKQIYKQIEQGNLPAIRLGPRSLRIRTSDALQFERQGSIGLPLNDSKRQRVAQTQWPPHRGAQANGVPRLVVAQRTAPHDSSSGED